MKKILLTGLLAMAVSAGAFAQGTISFQNLINGVGGRVYLNDTSTLAPTPFTVELLAGPVGTSIGSLTSVAIFAVTTPTAGQFFDGATITVTGAPAGNGTGDAAQNVTLAIRGWTGNFATYAAAVAGGAARGETIAFNNATGGAGTALPAAMQGWVIGNSLILTVPEPTTIALGGLGAAALLLFRRRK